MAVITRSPETNTKLRLRDRPHDQVVTDAEKNLICCFVIKTKVESKIKIEQYGKNNRVVLL